MLTEELVPDERDSEPRRLRVSSPPTTYVLRDLGYLGHVRKPPRSEGARALRCGRRHVRVGGPHLVVVDPNYSRARDGFIAVVTDV